ncbi:unnamed protein product [Amoebophrya sp. A120]|nr:unnamed protein product [Amoebophrya sp. A120]|eukprot:GSA120T00006684001.1
MPPSSNGGGSSASSKNGSRAVSKDSSASEAKRSGSKSGGARKSVKQGTGGAGSSKRASSKNSSNSENNNQKEDTVTETDEVPDDVDLDKDEHSSRQDENSSSVMGESTEEELREQEALERQRVIEVQQRLEALIRNVPTPETCADVFPREDRTKDCMEGKVRDFLAKCGSTEEAISGMKEDCEEELEKIKVARKDVKQWFRNTAEAGIQTAIGEALDAIKGLAKLRGQLLEKIDKQLSQNKTCIDEARSIKEAGQKLRDKVEDNRRYLASIHGEVAQLVQDWQDNVVNGKKHMLKEGGRFVKMAEKTVDRLGLIRCRETTAIDDEVYTAMLQQYTYPTARRRIHEIMGREPMSPEGRAALKLPIDGEEKEKTSNVPGVATVYPGTARPDGGGEGAPDAEGGTAGGGEEADVELPSPTLEVNNDGGGAPAENEQTAPPLGEADVADTTVAAGTEPQLSGAASSSHGVGTLAEAAPQQVADKIEVAAEAAPKAYHFQS